MQKISRDLIFVMFVVISLSGIHRPELSTKRGKNEVSGADTFLGPSFGQLRRKHRPQKTQLRPAQTMFRSECQPN
jgi:hypothetical protein